MYMLACAVRQSDLTPHNGAQRRPPSSLMLPGRLFPFPHRDPHIHNSLAMGGQFNRLRIGSVRPQIGLGGLALSRGGAIPGSLESAVAVFQLLLQRMMPRPPQSRAAKRTDTLTLEGHLPPPGSGFHALARTPDEVARSIAVL
jgi:hypothetical protein